MKDRSWLPVRYQSAALLVGTWLVTVVVAAVGVQLLANSLPAEPSTPFTTKFEISATPVDEASPVRVALDGLIPDFEHALAAGASPAALPVALPVAPDFSSVVVPAVTLPAPPTVSSPIPPAELEPLEAIRSERSVGVGVGVGRMLWACGSGGRFSLWAAPLAPGTRPPGC